MSLSFGISRFAAAAALALAIRAGAAQGDLPAQINALAASGGSIFAATSEGLFTSRDGLAWSQDAQIHGYAYQPAIMDGAAFVLASRTLYRFDGTAFRAVGPTPGNAAVNLTSLGNSLYASAWGEIWQSSDSGVHWSKRQTILGALFAGPARRLFSCDNNLECFLSSDGGGSWLPADTGVVQYPIGQAVFSADGAQVFAVSEDGSLLRFPGPRLLIAPDSARGGVVLAVIGKRLLAGFSGGGLWMSEDGGDSFHPAGAGLGGLGIGELATGGKAVFARAGAGLWRSDDAGASFVQVLPGNVHDTGLAAGGAQAFAASGGRLCRSGDDGKTWACADAPKDSGGAAQWAVAGGGLLRRGADGSLRSTGDGGKTWRAFASGLGEHPAGLLAAAEDRVYLVRSTADFSHEDLVYSSDSGKIWTDPSPGLPSDLLTGGAVLGARLFLGGDGGLSRSEDGGAHWRGCGPAGAIAALAVSGDSLFAALPDSGVYLSADGGDSWKKLGEGAGPAAPISLLLRPGALLAGASDGAIFRYDFAEGRWGACAGSPSGFAVRAFLAGPAGLLAGSDGAGLLVSKDEGRSWAPSPSENARPEGGGRLGNTKVTLMEDGPGARLRFTLEAPARLTLDLIDPAGRILSGAAIADGAFAAGDHVVALGPTARGFLAYRLKLRFSRGATRFCVGRLR